MSLVAKFKKDTKNTEKITTRSERDPLFPAKREGGASGLGGWEVPMAFCKINLQGYIFYMIKFKIYHKPLPLSKVNKHQNHCEALFNCTIQNIALNYSI